MRPIPVEFLAAAYLDVAWQTLTDPVEHEVRAFDYPAPRRYGHASP
jgi:hypothetical protein